MKLLTVLCGLAAFAGAAVSAQTTLTFDNCVDVGRKRLARGDVVRVACDSAYLRNRPTEFIVLRQKIIIDSLRMVDSALRVVTDSLRRRLLALVAVRESISTAQRMVIDTLWAIHRLDTLAFASLRGLFHTTDSLARASTQNTDHALTYVKKVRIASFIASGLGGGVVGGLGIKSGGSSGFNWSGFGIGAGVGVLTNWLLMKVVR